MPPTRMTGQQVGDGQITDADVATANKDGAAGTPSMRTLGTGSTQAAAGNHTHSGMGTVTSFSAGSFSPLFSTNVATATTTPALTFTASSQTQRTFLAGPTSGSAAAPTFRQIDYVDLPLFVNLPAVAPAGGDSFVIYDVSGTVNARFIYSDMFATQAQQETAAATLVAVAPATQHFHPSAAKGWVKFNAAGTISASYNVTSITDNGAGDFTVNWGTDFSGSNYCLMSNTDFTLGTDPILTSAFDNVSSGGSSRVLLVYPGVGFADADNVYVVAFGDQ